eukprot:scaffold42819_cov54-Phaeocystis_antarctica.AAC.2
MLGPPHPVYGDDDLIKRDLLEIAPVLPPPLAADSAALQRVPLGPLSPDLTQTSPRPHRAS